MLNKNLKKYLKNHKNKYKQKPYGPTDTYRKFVIVIKEGRVPYTTITKGNPCIQQVIHDCYQGNPRMLSKIFKNKNN